MKVHPAERFWSKVGLEDENGCRLWQAPGYSMYWGDGKVGIQRIAWQLIYGKEPRAGFDIVRTCHNKLCVSSHHLKEVPRSKRVLHHKPVEERFWEKVGPLRGDGCRIWQGVKTIGGYGNFSVAGKLQGAHRVAFFLANGRWPSPGLHVRHLCHNKLCVEATHLAEGTSLDNVADARKIGAHYKFALRKLTDDQVRLIRRSSKYTVTASELGVSFNLARKVYLRMTYQDVPDMPLPKEPWDTPAAPKRDPLPLQQLLQRRRRRSGGGGRLVRFREPATSSERIYRDVE